MSPSQQNPQPKFSTIEKVIASSCLVLAGALVVVLMIFGGQRSQKLYEAYAVDSAAKTGLTKDTLTFNGNKVTDTQYVKDEYGKEQMKVTATGTYTVNDHQLTINLGHKTLHGTIVDQDAAFSVQPDKNWAAYQSQAE